MAKQIKTKQKSNKYNQKRNYTRDRVKSEPRERYTDDDTSHKYNDVSWYAKNEYMLRDAASLPFAYRVGDVVYSELNDTVQASVVNTKTVTHVGPRAVPGLMAIRFMPTIGISVDASSPANLAAQNIYSYVRYMNSGAKNYDQADLMLYLMAMDSVYMLWNWLKRIYGYMRTYSVKNAYMPRAFAFADNALFSDGIQNLADFRMQLNSLAAQISSFCVPAVMPLMIRHSWMVSNIYKDSDTEKAQMYMFVPAMYYQYDETGSQFGGRLVHKFLPTEETNISGLINRLKDAINAIAYSEDIGVMSGDILKAYGQDKLFKITPLDPDYMITPVYNEEVLNQIHNLVMVNSTSTIQSEEIEGSLSIYQNPDTGFLVWNPKFILNQEGPQIQPGKTVMLNMPWDNVTPANVMVGSRLSITMNVKKGQYFTLNSCGSEIVSQVSIYVMNVDGTINRNPVLQCVDVGDADGITDIIKLSNFDWHPLIHIYNVGSAEVRDFGILGDISNYTFVDERVLAKLHQTALLSEFNVPQIGSF